MQTLAIHTRYVIDITKPWHVACWAEELGVLDIVDLVGNQARAVEYYLGLREVREEQRKTVAPANASLAPTTYDHA